MRIPVLLCGLAVIFGIMALAQTQEVSQSKAKQSLSIHFPKLPKRLPTIHQFDSQIVTHPKTGAAAWVQWRKESKGKASVWYGLVTRLIEKSVDKKRGPIEKKAIAKFIDRTMTGLYICTVPLTNKGRTFCTVNKVGGGEFPEDTQKLADELREIYDAFLASKRPPSWQKIPAGELGGYKPLV